VKPTVRALSRLCTPSKRPPGKYMSMLSSDIILDDLVRVPVRRGHHRQSERDKADQDGDRRTEAMNGRERTICISQSRRFEQGPWGRLRVLLGRRRRERLGRLLPRWLGTVAGVVSGLVAGMVAARAAATVAGASSRGSSSYGLLTSIPRWGFPNTMRAIGLCRSRGQLSQRVLRVMVWVMLAYGLGRRVVLAGSLRAGGPCKRSALV
jgi:hypothetical protein